ncbi:MAG: RluA family pseudouridine synthase, partial [Firmicutes bacterium]|nr:RluA family pseudouridine synthase [Bacillota bacterium]
PVKKSYIPSVGDIIKVNDNDFEQLDVVPQDLPLDIVYEDEFLMVVNKSKGIVTHPAHGNYLGTLVNALVFYTKNKLSCVDKFRPGIVHRLDKDTSGLLLIAKNNFIHEKLSNQFKTQSIQREYLAIVHGKMKNKLGTIDFPIGRDLKNRKKMAVVYKNSKNAVTHFDVLKIFNEFSYVKFSLETGRTHQIRIHSSYIGHPIAGDILYGASKSYNFLKGQCLHASNLGFDHPITGERLKLSSEVPYYFKEFIKTID